ncbi:alpha/beta hydrolase-fold protein [Pedobacter sp. L105]|uniref:alpha/beta hydrolase-fold protein n=1 Tax=Pedobacter sp. L105 TaxID=1641871 RepID=UPI00131DECB6|nr:alpha/beta hydrolase-fold protein [Pedobacter sp. L105]
MNQNKIKLVLALFFYFFSNSAFSQSIVKKAVYCKALNDTLLFNVWLPYGYEKGIEEYPVIYLHNYGALSNYGMNVAAELNKKKYKFPKSIVVEFTGSSNTKSISEIIDFSYFREGLEGKGERYLSTLKNEIFPFIKKTFSTSDFRAYMGHSYFASYANLLFAHYPDMFDGYILFSPESLNEFQEKFELDTISYDYKNKFFFVITGSKDVERRRNFNKIISNKVSRLNNVFSESQIEESADHNSIVDDGLPKALKFLFHKYFTISHLDSADLIRSYQNEISVVKSIYKMKNVNLRTYDYELYALGSQYKNKEFINYLISTEKGILNDPLDVFNLGYIYMDTIKDKNMAEKYYRKSIAICVKNKTPKSAFNGYSWLAKLYSDDEDYKKSFATLEEGYQLTGNYALIYQAAKLSEKDNSLITSSIRYLKEVIENFNGSDLEYFGIKIEDVNARMQKLQQLKSPSN